MGDNYCGYVMQDGVSVEDALHGIYQLKDAGLIPDFMIFEGFGNAQMEYTAWVSHEFVWDNEEKILYMREDYLWEERDSSKHFKVVKEIPLARGGMLQARY